MWFEFRWHWFGLVNQKELIPSPWQRGNESINWNSGWIDSSSGPPFKVDDVGGNASCDLAKYGGKIKHKKNICIFPIALEEEKEEEGEEEGELIDIQKEEEWKKPRRRRGSDFRLFFYRNLQFGNRRQLNWSDSTVTSNGEFDSAMINWMQLSWNVKREASTTSNRISFWWVSPMRRRVVVVDVYRSDAHLHRTGDVTTGGVVCFYLPPVLG